jgi:NAD(P)-dependent dehydrogenase (short-subunit alcohol dehydrogenase family)
MMQLDLEPQGITVLAVQPGVVLTDMMTKYEVLRNHIPRYSSSELAGDTIVWLAKERRDWLGGRYVNCQWDMRDLEQRREEIVASDKLKFDMRF